jgi:RNA polymerase sigma factor (sigma-70 family)
MRYAKNKEEEFEQLMARFTQFIRSLVQKYNLHKYGIDPDDICQDVRIKLWKLLCGEKNVINYPSYIRKIVNSSVIDQLRKIRKEEAIYSQEKQRQVAEQEQIYGSDLARYKTMEDIIGRAVNSLIESRRQAVKLYLLNLSVQEISDYLNWTVDKTRNLLYRGLADLKRALRKMDIDYEDK